MTKKRKVLLVLIVILIVLLPVATFATIKMIQIPIMDEKAIEEANQKETDRALAEKERFSKEHPHNGNNLVSFANEDTNLTEEEEQVIKEQNQKEAENERKITAIMERYYPKEFKEVIQKREKDSENVKIVDLTKNSLSSSDKELYDLILNVLENEYLSEDESEVLKDYIDSQMFNIEKDENLKTRAENVLK